MHTKKRRNGEECVKERNECTECAFKGGTIDTCRGLWCNTQKLGIMVKSNVEGDSMLEKKVLKNIKIDP